MSTTRIGSQRSRLPICKDEEDIKERIQSTTRLNHFFLPSCVLILIRALEGPLLGQNPEAP